MELVLFVLVPLGMAVLGIAMIANAIDSVKKSIDEMKR